MTVNAKSTKAEILEALKVIQREKRTLESEIKQLKASETKTITTDNNPKQTRSEQPVMDKVLIAQKSMDKTIEILAGVKAGFGGAVSNLSEQLIGEATKLEELQEKYLEESEQLNELHELNAIGEETLDTLFQTYTESAKSFEEQISQRREELEQQLQELKKSWDKEKSDRTIEIKERDRTYLKNKQRDEEEYNYNLEQEKKLSEDRYNQNQKNLYKELNETRLQQEKEWQEREKTISDREKQYSEAKEKVEIFEKQLAEKIERGKQDGQNIGNWQAKVKSDLRSKEVEGENKNYELRIIALENNIQNQEVRLTSLSQQLTAALKQVQDLAVKAIEGTSNRNSYDAMREIALEQAKNPQKNK